MSNDPAQQTGLVVAAYGRRGRLYTNNGENLPFFCKGRQLRTVCGDNIQWEKTATGETVVTGISPRTNELQRLGSRGTGETVAANLTLVAVVIAPSPTPDYFVADRYLCAAELQSCKTVIVCNKADIDSPDQDEISNYERAGYLVINASAKSGQNTDELARVLRDEISILVGQSGVGKSSLINQLVPDAQAATGELSAGSGEGKHTTTASLMHPLAGGGWLIDSPGVRDFLPLISEAASIPQGFPEIYAASKDCRFSNCKHIREPDCAVRAALEQEQISPRRYESYKRLRRSADGTS
jgi:ribosome biogenesis GTPase